MTTIFGLALRQLAGQRRFLIVLFLSAAPVVVAAVYRQNAGPRGADYFADNILNQLLVATVLPLSMLVTGTISFGHEIEDKTIGYLVLKPMPRWKIVLPKLAAVILMGGLPAALGGAITMAVMPTPSVLDAAGVGLALLVGAVVYGAIFTWAGLMTQHAAAFGLVYVFLWEAAVAQFLAGGRYLSVRQYVLSLIDALTPDRLFTLSIERVELPAAMVGVILLTVVFSGLAVRRLNRMDFP
ncbi:MAG: ABC transporter permease subunit [Chloroflexi bacterium]|nr:ABC transporter permease subunit [Chloroflexota bacterium]